MDMQCSIIQVAVRNTRSGKQVFDVSCSDGKTRQVWEAGMANAINAFAGSGAIISIRVTQKQNGQYLNESIQAFAAPGQALPPEQAGGGLGAAGGGNGFKAGGGGRGGMTPTDKTRIAKMGAQGSASTLVAALFQGAGPEAYEEAVSLLDKLTLKLYKSARSHETEAEIKGDAAPNGATVLQPGAAAADPAVLAPGATAADVAAAVPGVVVGTQALPAGGAADATAAADVTAQAASEQGDPDIDWN